MFFSEMCGLMVISLSDAEQTVIIYRSFESYTTHWILADKRW